MIFLDFKLSKEQIEICQEIREFSKENLNKNVYEDDEASTFPAKKWKMCADFGIQGLPIPEEYGGSGQSMLDVALAIEALGYGCKDEGLVFSICAHMLTCLIPIWYFGTDKQKEKYLPGLISGDLIGGNGITEPDTGSDSAAMSTNVVKEDGQYIINGSKMFVTNAPVADLLVIYAKHPGGMKMLDVSAFIIDKENQGIKVGQDFKKMGLRTSTIGEVILDNCKIPLTSVLGRERLGMKVFNYSMLWERIIMGAYHIGAMQQQFDMVLDYTNMRSQFGKKIAKFQRIADMLVDMKMRIETSKLMLYKNCWNFDNNKLSMADASMSKLLTSESKVKNSLDAVQIFGAYGYMKESDVERQLRDSMAAKIYSGTSEIQRKIISESLEKYYE